MKKFLFSLIALAMFLPTQAQDKKDKKGLPLEATRSLDINTDQGTWMSLDVHPDGSKLLFDLLGDIYELPIQGGKPPELQKA